MFTIGLTGGVAMGKSTVAQMFADAGAAVFDADQAVHTLYRGAAVVPIAVAFPGMVIGDAVDRGKLADVVAADPAALARLEAIVHPLVAAMENEFLAAAERSARDVAVLDIPLLFETGADRRVDAVVVVSTAPNVQLERVRRRGSLTDAGLAALMARQMPDAEKRHRAHFVIDTGRPFAATRAEVRGIMRTLAATAAARARRFPHPARQPAEPTA